MRDLPSWLALRGGGSSVYGKQIAAPLPLARAKAGAQLVWPIITLQMYKGTLKTFPATLYLLGAAATAVSLRV